MLITVFTKQGCFNCDELKTRLKNLNIPFRELDADSALNPSAKDYLEKHPDWRTSGAVDAYALLQLHDALPVTVINGRANTYEETTAYLDTFEDQEKRTADGLEVVKESATLACGVA